MGVIGYHCSHEQFEPGALLAYVRLAEQAGFRAAMCSDHLFPWSERQGQSGFAWSWLGAALEATGLSFGTVNAPAYRYNPVVIAQAAATLSSMYPGRFWLALGSGQALNEHVTGEAWPDKPERDAILLQCAEIMRALWAGEQVSRNGPVRVTGARLYTLPEEPPLLLGAAISPETARWVGAWADGLITIGKPAEELERVVEAFRLGGGEGKPMFLQEQVSWAATENEAREAAHDQWRANVLDAPVLERLAYPAEFDMVGEFVRPDALDRGIKISSDPERHAEWLEEDLALGFDQVLVHGVGRDQRAFIEAYGRDVLPRFAERGAAARTAGAAGPRGGAGGEEAADEEEPRRPGVIEVDGSPPADYKPIADYGAVGDCRTLALVGRDGSVDWCCLPRLASPSVFAAILDRRRGGRFRVRPSDPLMGEQSYLESTNVLRTLFLTGEGVLSVTDFMPLSGSLDGAGRSSARGELQRLVACEADEVTVEVEWSPRFDYGRAYTRIARTEGGAVAEGGGKRVALSGLPPRAEVDLLPGPTLRARFPLSAGHRAALATGWGGERDSADPVSLLEETVSVWRSWVDKPEATGNRRWAGPWSRAVIRTELALKLLIDADTGAIAAAGTTSLPEWVGGPRNWDYRYAWIRDASETVQALSALGHREEALRFLKWAESVSESEADPERLKIVYGLHGETDLAVEELDHLEGYRGSRPVLVGNAAYEQVQHDVYAQLLSAAYELARAGEELSDGMTAFLSRVADAAAELWRKPDSGIWEHKTGPQHFVHSKVMAWVALDRAVHLAESGLLPGDAGRWRSARREVREEILDRGVDPATGAFVQTYGSADLDAANLQVALQEFLPMSDRRVRATIDRTRERLSEERLLRRYVAPDGIPGREGAFVLPTLWLVDALALSGRLEEAREIFDDVLDSTNHVGLLSEMIDPGTRSLLGNFPQAFSHIGLINSALYLSRAEGREIPVPSLVGDERHRATVGHA